MTPEKPKKSDSSGNHTIRLDQTMNTVSNQKAIARGQSVLVSHLAKSGISDSPESKPKFSDSKWDPQPPSSEKTESVSPTNEIKNASQRLTDSVDTISSILYLVLDKLSLQRYIMYGMVILFVSLIYSNLQLRSAIKTLDASNLAIVSIKKSLETSPEEILDEVKKATSALHEAREKEESKSHIELVPGDKEGELAVVIHPPSKEEPETKDSPSKEEPETKDSPSKEEPETKELKTGGPKVKEVVSKVDIISEPKPTPMVNLQPKPKSRPRMKKKKRSSVRVPIKVKRVRESL